MITVTKASLLDATDAENQLLTALQMCAVEYLILTDYEDCTIELTKALSSLTAVVYGRSIGFLSGGYCPVGYCEFVRCIRRINANKLVSKLECIHRMVFRNLRFSGNIQQRIR